MNAMAGLSACAVPSASQAQWTKIGTSGSNAVHMADPARIRSVGSVRHIWVKIDHSHDASVTFRSEMNLNRINRETQTFKVLTIMQSDSYGRLVRSQGFPGFSIYDSAPILQKTIVETVAVVACVGQ